jgi:hypothetical protein
MCVAFKRLVMQDILRVRCSMSTRVREKRSDETLEHTFRVNETLLYRNFQLSGGRHSNQRTVGPQQDGRAIHHERAPLSKPQIHELQQRTLHWAVSLNFSLDSLTWRDQLPDILQPVQ